MKRIEQNLRAKVNNENVGDAKRVETPRDAENLELGKRIDRIRECLVAPFREKEVAVEPVKGSISNALKRAAVKWGIGRYLYNLGDSWAEISESGRYSFKAEDGKVYRWNPLAMPNWARISESLNWGDTVFGNSDEKSNWTPSGHGDFRSDGAQLREGSHTEWKAMSIHFGKIQI